jgi:catalase
MHMVMWIMSDRTIPRSLRMIEGFGVHSFRLINNAGVSTFVKFHWRPKLGLQSTIWDEAVKIAGADPDFHRRDMFEAVTTGNFPEWEFAVQLFTQEEADNFPFDAEVRIKHTEEKQHHGYSDSWLLYSHASLCPYRAWELVWIQPSSRF